MRYSSLKCRAGQPEERGQADCQKWRQHQAHTICQSQCKKLTIPLGVIELSPIKTINVGMVASPKQRDGAIHRQGQVPTRPIDQQSCQRGIHSRDLCKPEKGALTPPFPRDARNTPSEYIKSRTTTKYMLA